MNEDMKPLSSPNKEKWKDFYETVMKHFWNDEAAELAEKIPCKDEELKKVLALGKNNILEMLDNRHPCFNGLKERDVLMTDEGIGHYKSLMMRLPDNISTWPKPFYIENKQYWPAYYEWIMQFFKKEHKMIAKKIPCNDKEVKNALAIAMPDIFEKLEKKHPAFGNELGKEILKNEYGAMHYKYILISQYDGLDKFPIKLNAPTDEEWNSFYKSIIKYWVESDEKAFDNLPCIDRELKQMLVIGRKDIFKSLDKPVSCFENKLMKDVLKTKEGVDHLRSLIIHLPYGIMISYKRYKKISS